MNKDWKTLLKRTGLDSKKLFELSESIFYADLHHRPFKDVILLEQLNGNVPPQKYGFKIEDNDLAHLLKIRERRRFQDEIFKQEIYKNDFSILSGMLFYTRPISSVELSFLQPSWCSNRDKLELFKQTLDLFKVTFPSAAIDIPEKEGGLVQVNIENEDINLDRYFALTSFQTNHLSWVDVVRDRVQDSDPERYSRLSELVNSILKCKKNIDYVLFPELSIPRSIVIDIATRLKSKRISLIAGVEYKKEKAPKHYPENIKGIVYNQLIYFLNVNHSGMYDQVCVIQEKVTAAIEEAGDLFQEGGKILQASDKNKYLINHGGLFLSGLICNDLLNIDYRKDLRGEIDALIVVEWNKDVDTYDALISATANDLHCFVFQVNNRLYGDTRLRAPYKESYMRDRVRVRGGELDYFVVTSIEVKKLREFQDRYVSASSYFKPVPTGYMISKKRSNLKDG